MESESQTTQAVIMIRPARFTSNPDTAASNSFQADLGSADPEEVRAKAQEEFDRLAQALEEAGVEVHCFDDTADPETPDALFPNNWLSTHEDGRSIFYPMEAPSRRKERRPDILDALKTQGYRCEQLDDLSHNEDKERFLEGTGSLILDRENRIAYACLSSRTHPALFHDWCERYQYDPEAFTALNDGQEIYHTNVLMCLGDEFAVICDQAIENEQERIRVIGRLEKTGHEVVRITPEQMNQFAGNMLQLRNRDGRAVIAMSEQARQSLNKEQLDTLARYGKIVSADIRTIETYAGGSVRCMLAENFLPKA